MKWTAKAATERQPQLPQLDRRLNGSKTYRADTNRLHNKLIAETTMMCTDCISRQHAASEKDAQRRAKKKNTISKSNILSRSGATTILLLVLAIMCAPARAMDRYGYMSEEYCVRDLRDRISRKENEIAALQQKLEHEQQKLEHEQQELHRMENELWEMEHPPGTELHCFDAHCLFFDKNGRTREGLTLELGLQNSILLKPNSTHDAYVSEDGRLELKAPDKSRTNYPMLTVVETKHGSRVTTDYKLIRGDNVGMTRARRQRTDDWETMAKTCGLVETGIGIYPNSGTTNDEPFSIIINRQ